MFKGFWNLKCICFKFQTIKLTLKRINIIKLVALLIIFIYHLVMIQIITSICSVMPLLHNRLHWLAFYRLTRLTVDLFFVPLSNPIIKTNKTMLILSDIHINIFQKEDGLVDEYKIVGNSNWGDTKTSTCIDHKNYVHANPAAFECNVSDHTVTAW